MSKFYSKLFACLSLLLVSSLFTAVEVKADDPKPEEIVAKHLDSIGTQEKRAAVKNQMAVGTAQFSVLKSAAFTRGKRAIGAAVILSEGSKMFLGAKYEAPEYPFDEILFDAKSVNVPFTPSGNRPLLGELILKHRYLVSEGLLGGAISTGWSLFDLTARQAKIKGGGKKKIDGRQTYAINYIIKGSSAFSVKLFFDAETFQHVRTEYQQVFSAPMGATMRDSAQQKQTVQKMTEEFSNFKEANGLTLPHTYRLNYLDDGNTTSEFEWNFEFREYLHNQKIDAASFEMKQN